MSLHGHRLVAAHVLPVVVMTALFALLLTYGPEVLQRGRLGKRLVRRAVTRRGLGPLLDALFRSL